MNFSLPRRKPFDELRGGQEELGIDTHAGAGRPAHVPAAGQVRRGVPAEFDRLELLDALVEVYARGARASSAEQGAKWVQLDEPVLVEDRTTAELDALERAYEALAEVHERTEDLRQDLLRPRGEAYSVLRDLPVEGIGLDFLRGEPDLDRQWSRADRER